APRSSLARLVLSWGVRLVVWGVVGGAAISLAAAPVLAASLFGVEARDPWSLALAALALLAAGTVACLAPAWRATRVDPTESLRDA
ncbi:MAG: hypothetical protein AAFY88_30380, partial [Acidobacteriota bacterium]